MPRLRLSATAEADIENLLRYTFETFGETAQARYEQLVFQGLTDIAVDPLRPASRDRSEFGQGVRSYHLHYSRERARTATGIVQRPRHFVLYRFAQPEMVGMGRVLHDAMELSRHIPKDFGDES